MTQMNKDKTYGTYVYNDGGRYEGGFKDGRFDGQGTWIYEYAQNVSYDATSDPSQIHGARYTMQFKDGHAIPDMTKFVSAPTPSGSPSFVGFTYEGPMDLQTHAFKGKGRVTFQDGRIFEGNLTFDSTPTPYLWFGKKDSYWATSRMISSKISGPGTMRWPDGSVFVGVAYDYYLFDRSVYDGYCPRSRFIGQGTLTRPGKPDYQGLVSENWERTEVSPSSKERFDDIVDDIAGCMPTILAARNNQQRLQAEYDASMAKARTDAHNMLMRDLAAMPAQMANTMAEVGAASRGTTVQAEQEKAARDAQFYANIAKEQEDPDSQYNRDKRAEERRRDAEARAERERLAASEALRKKRNESTASAADADHAAEENQRKADEQKQKDIELKAQQDRDAKRLAAQQQAEENIRQAKKKQDEADEAYKAKVAQEQKDRDEAFAKSQYLSTMQQSIKLSAIHCPDGKGAHYVVGLLPKIKPAPVSCIDVHYTASCIGSTAKSSGVINSFLGAGTDCFFGDAGSISPTPACAPKEVRVQVTKVAACGE